MATRTIRKFIVKAVYGKELAAMREEFSKLVDEVEELKTKFASHTHTGVTTGEDDTGATKSTFTTFAKPDAKKIS